MSLVCRLEPKAGTIIGIWKMEESSDQLLSIHQFTPLEIQSVSAFTSEKRRCEWLSSRILITALLNEKLILNYDINGKPYLHGVSKSVSISHSNDHVAVLISASRYAGIDIEPVTRKVMKIATRFMSDNEIAVVAEDGNKALLYWCSKEVLLKICGKRDIDFRQRLGVRARPDGGTGKLEGNIISEDGTNTFLLNYFIFNGQLIVWATG
ncbi:MAG: 4'-phosphopantetheinyl transferase superfamily protein [Bacteroidia bacterium]|nr:4'-phosphopantetheinyl transferase superfamily protein [Bacteroidia bacterium]